MADNNKMRCYYCDQIADSAPAYVPAEAAYDLFSEAPRCARHWRFLCARCQRPRHFMALAYCEETRQLFCSNCASGRQEVAAPFWAWDYYFSYQSPWSGRWHPALDRLEYEGRHPFTSASEMRPHLWPEEGLVRYPPRDTQWRPSEDFDDGDVQASWDRNAARWHASYDEDGDPNRRYHSDEPMLSLLGEVRGLRVLDVGSGNGYLCRKLARSGAQVTGVELSGEFLRLARDREASAPLGITYRHGSASTMPFLPDASFDKAVSNYVLMDVYDYRGAVREVFRVLRAGGTFVAVISHPCFACGPGTWARPVPDSPRQEDRRGYYVDSYFQRGPYLGQWRNLDPVLSFHRPLRDYWEAFASTGFVVVGFEEPSLTERGRRELPPSQVAKAARIPFSCIFQLTKPG